MNTIRDRSGHVAIICLLLFFFFLLFQTHETFQRRNQGRIRNENVDGLEAALSRASTTNKTVIITIVNKAYVETGNERNKSMFDLFLYSFRIGDDTRRLVDHLLIVAVDSTSYRRCRDLGLRCHILETDVVDFERGSEKMYMSREFIKMMWRRTLFIQDVLKRGYDVVFTDTDVLWLRNPFPRLNVAVDLQLSTDVFNGQDWSERNLINTGFYFVRSNNRTISLFDAWYARGADAPKLKEQDVLNAMVKRGVLREMGLTVRFLDTRFFSGFCQGSNDAMAVCTVHANCCRTISAKLVDLTAVIRDWKRLRRLGSTANERASFGGTGHVACDESWRGFNFTI